MRKICIGIISSFYGVSILFAVLNNVHVNGNICNMIKEIELPINNAHIRITCIRIHR